VEHNYLDELAQRDSPVHRLEARVKFIGALTLVVAAVLLPPERTWPFVVYLALAACLVALARLPLGIVLKRAAAFGPFILTAVLLLPFSRPGDGTVSVMIPIGSLQVRLYRAGLLGAKAILLKSLISALSMIVLISTTPFSRLLRAMERLRLPRLLLAIMAFLYRYLFLLRGEFLRLTRAARSRNWEAGPIRVRLRAIGGIVGSLFLRTYSRGERVYTAMLARGFDGRFRPLTETSLAARDIAWLAGFLALVLGVLAVALFGGPAAIKA
jgi:cobalt/nickel transport system permease protein